MLTVMYQMTVDSNISYTVQIISIILRDCFKKGGKVGEKYRHSEN